MFTLRSQCSKYARHFHPNGDGTVTMFQEAYSPLAEPGPNERHFITSKKILPVDRAREICGSSKVTAGNDINASVIPGLFYCSSQAALQKFVI